MDLPKKVRESALPGWDSGLSEPVFHMPRQVEARIPLKVPEGTLSARPESATVREDGIGRVLQIGMGARSNVRPKRVSLT
jgi:hypothetical protein